VKKRRRAVEKPEETMMGMMILATLRTLKEEMGMEEMGMEEMEMEEMGMEGMEEMKEMIEVVKVVGMMVVEVMVGVVLMLEKGTMIALMSSGMRLRMMGMKPTMPKMVMAVRILQAMGPMILVVMLIGWLLVVVWLVVRLVRSVWLVSAMPAAIEIPSAILLSQTRPQSSSTI
jgi:hypothetical protein